MAKADRCQCCCHTHINHGNVCVARAHLVDVADKSPSTCHFDGLMPLHASVSRAFHDIRRGHKKMWLTHSDPDPIMELFLDRTVKLLREAHRLLCDFQAVREDQVDLTELFRKFPAKS